MSAARTKAPAGLRPYLPADAGLLAEIFRASVTELTGEDYTEEQQAAWASSADDEDAFAQKLAGELTLVATIEGAAVGFASLAGKDRIDMLYVHPAAAGQGVGALLCDALEKLAAARGATKLSADASDTALGFFVHRGFVAQQRNTVVRNGEWLATTTVQKPLAAPTGGTA
jgi:putative acetyltransferase